MTFRVPVWGAGPQALEALVQQGGLIPVHSTSGQAYRVWDDTGGFGDTMEEHARMAADIGRGVSDGKVLYLPNHLRLEPVAPS